MKKLMTFFILMTGVSAFGQEVGQKKVLEETIDQMCIERMSEYFEEGSRQFYASINACIEGEYKAILENLSENGSFANRDSDVIPSGSARACLPDEDCF